MTDQWAVDLLNEYKATREQLKELHNEVVGEERASIGAMIRGMSYTMRRLERYVPVDDRDESRPDEREGKVHVWDPVWLSQLRSQENLEDMVLEKLCPSRPEWEARVIVDLGMLPRRQSEAIQMYADGLSYTAVGDVMGVEKGTVSKHLQIVRDKMREGVQLVIDLQ